MFPRHHKHRRVEKVRVREQVHPQKIEEGRGRTLVLGGKGSVLHVKRQGMIANMIIQPVHGGMRNLGERGGLKKRQNNS